MSVTAAKISRWLSALGPGEILVGQRNQNRAWSSTATPKSFLWTFYFLSVWFSSPCTPTSQFSSSGHDDDDDDEDGGGTSMWLSAHLTLNTSMSLTPDSSSNDNMTSTQKPIPCSPWVTRTTKVATISLRRAESNSVSWVLYKNYILQRIRVVSGFFLLTRGFSDFLLYGVVGYLFSPLSSVLSCDCTIRVFTLSNVVEYLADFHFPFFWGEGRYYTKYCYEDS